ncbi:MAG: ParB/RepB/Spo0J family partition protein [Clostridia bacterium]|nr:ParB/RepB/Spo0J family partition protein [Clostridia bacterium]
MKISRIEPNRDQPRRKFNEEALEELAESIRIHGVITPVVVRRLEGERYQLIAGERRFRASRLAGLEELPARVLDVDESEAYQMAMVENLQREDLDPMEEAEGFRVLMETYGLSQADAAKAVGRSRPAVANALRLLSLPGEVQRMVTEGELTAGHARAVLTLQDEKQRISAAKIVAEKGMSVRQAEAFCAAFGKEKTQKTKPAGVDYAADLAERLSRDMGRRVQVTCKKGRGTLVLHYDDLDDLDALIARLTAR